MEQTITNSNNILDIKERAYATGKRKNSIARVRLKKGKGELSLKIPEIPGNEGIEFRLLMLRRIS